LKKAKGEYQRQPRLVVLDVPRTTPCDHAGGLVETAYLRQKVANGWRLCHLLQMKKSFSGHLDLVGGREL